MVYSTHLRMIRKTINFTQVFMLSMCSLNVTDAEVQYAVYAVRTTGDAQKVVVFPTCSSNAMCGTNTSQASVAAMLFSFDPRPGRIQIVIRPQGLPPWYNIHNIFISAGLVRTFVTPNIMGNFWPEIYL